jgi:ParB-like chromosome segregation protein Spo0J
MPRTRTHRGVEYPVSDAHPAAECFPWLPEDRLQELADSITAHGGLIYKVRRLPDGRVYDGRNRELACRVAGVEPEYADSEMTDDEVIKFVRHANLARRDLTPSQRAAAAAELAALEGGPSHGAVAEQFGVGVRTVSAAAAVLKADKPLFEAVKAGAVAASLAEAAVKGLPAPVRAAALADPGPGRRDAGP